MPAVAVEDECDVAYGLRSKLAVAAVMIITLSSSRSGRRFPLLLRPDPAPGERGSSRSGSSSEKGKRPVASSTRVMPRDQMSDLTEYSAPWIRSGCGGVDM